MVVGMDGMVGVLLWLTMMEMVFYWRINSCKNTGAVEYVVAVTGPTDSYSGWGDQRSECFVR